MREIEFYGGPADGTLRAYPEGALPIGSTLRSFDYLRNVERHDTYVLNAAETRYEHTGFHEHENALR